MRTFNKASPTTIAPHEISSFSTMTSNHETHMKRALPWRSKKHLPLSLLLKTDNLEIRFAKLKNRDHIWAPLCDECWHSDFWASRSSLLYKVSTPMWCTEHLFHLASCCFVALYLQSSCTILAFIVFSPFSHLHSATMAQISMNVRLSTPFILRSTLNGWGSVKHRSNVHVCEWCTYSTSCDKVPSR